MSNRPADGAASPHEEPYPLVYRWGAGPFGPNPVRAAKKGQRCRVLIRSRRMRSVLLEFADGSRMISSARAVARSR